MEGEQVQTGSRSKAGLDGGWEKEQQKWKCSYFTEECSYVLNKQNTEVGITDFLRLQGSDDGFNSKKSKLRAHSKIIHHLTSYSFPSSYVISFFYLNTV